MQASRGWVVETASLCTDWSDAIEPRVLQPRGRTVTEEKATRQCFFRVMSVHCLSILQMFRRTLRGFKFMIVACLIHAGSAGHGIARGSLAFTFRDTNPPPRAIQPESHAQYTVLNATASGARAYSRYSMKLRGSASNIAPMMQSEDHWDIEAVTARHMHRSPGPRRT